MKFSPGAWYETDDDMLIRSIKAQTIKLKKSDSIVKALERAGVTYTEKRGCNCSGGHMNVIFPMFEVYEE